MATINDVVLIHLEDAPVSFARVESILPDAKKDWYHVKFLMFQIPLQVVTWILKDDYINGDDFHMNGKKMKITKVESPVEELPLSKSKNLYDKKLPDKMGSQEKQQGNIIDFPGFKKNHEPDDAG
ncbi:MAG: hypothetical protein PF690_13390 [Deltaproteobacteria bacterium]|jgi:hypothetical protein|nr:hypothetical protein [Deltaproteobacteria bacterium]